MADLRARILGRLDTRDTPEAVAHVAQAYTRRPADPPNSGTWTLGRCEVIDSGSRQVIADRADELVVSGEHGEHIATWSPAAVFTLCAGARQILELHQPEHADHIDGD